MREYLHRIAFAPAALGVLLCQCGEESDRSTGDGAGGSGAVGAEPDAGVSGTAAVSGSGSGGTGGGSAEPETGATAGVAVGGGDPGTGGVGTGGLSTGGGGTGGIAGTTERPIPGPECIAPCIWQLMEPCRPAGPCVRTIDGWTARTCYGDGATTGSIGVRPECTRSNALPSLLLPRKSWENRRAMGSWILRVRG